MNRPGMLTGMTIVFVLTWPTVSVFAQAPETDSVRIASRYSKHFCMRTPMPTTRKIVKALQTYLQ